MKRKRIDFRLVIFPVVIASVFSFCSREQLVNKGDRQRQADENIISQIDILPREPLSELEKESVLYMREEEKLARDVYKAMNRKWNANVFYNIAQSEQRHMDAVLHLLNKYSLADPVGANADGVFKNAVLQQLYHDLVAKGNANIAEAYKVGATIEDLDIFDLRKALQQVDNQDIKFVFENLERGSRNHMRAFYRNLLNVGAAYTPRYISMEEFNAIINAPMGK